MQVPDGLFKAYDVRGLSPQELSPAIAHGIGRALADYLPDGSVAVGRDMRGDSADLAKAVTEGLVEQGRRVIDIGQVTSDMIYYAIGSEDLAGGAMITASHNPGQYNGIKFTGHGVVPIGQESGLPEIKNKLKHDDFKPAKAGGQVIAKNITHEWVTHAIELSGDQYKPLKVGIDAGNGMASIVVPDLKKLTPLKITGLYLELDGSFPNHPANPLVADNLQDLVKLVKDDRLDVGIAFDGDGDRAFLIDEDGQIVSASLLGALLADHFLKLDKGATVLYNVICSRIVPETIEAAGGQAVRTRVGHSFIKAKMHETGAVFACEHSGHFYYRDNYRADSGLITALTALNMLSQSGKKLSELVSPYKKYTDSGEISSKVNDQAVVVAKLKQQYQDGKQDEIDGLTVNYADWWFNVRPSNTEPLIRLNVESLNPAITKQKTEELLKIIRTKTSVQAVGR